MFEIEFNDEKFVEAVKECEDICTSDYISEVIGCSTRTCNRRLDDLAEKGMIKKNKLGKMNIWKAIGDKI